PLSVRGIFPHLLSGSVWLCTSQCQRAIYLGLRGLGSIPTTCVDIRNYRDTRAFRKGASPLVVWPDDAARAQSASHQRQLTAPLTAPTGGASYRRLSPSASSRCPINEVVVSTPPSTL